MERLSHAMSEESRGRGKIDLCAFCRKPNPSSDEHDIERIKKLMCAKKAYAFHRMAGLYENGMKGVQRDMTKANELLLKAGELGCAAGYHNLGIAYDDGRGVEVDKKKSKHYYELAAINGDVCARHNLGYTEYEAGNHHRAMKHFILSARAGDKNSLDNVKIGFMKGLLTMDEYANTLRANESRHNEMKSDARDKARAHLNNGVMRV